MTFLGVVISKEGLKIEPEKNKSSKEVANTKNSERNPSISRICQLLSMVHKKLQLIYNITYAVNMKGPNFQVRI